MAKHLHERREKRSKVNEKQLRKQCGDDNGETTVGMVRFFQQFELQ